MLIELGGSWAEGGYGECNGRATLVLASWCNYEIPKNMTRILFIIIRDINMTLP